MMLKRFPIAVLLMSCTFMTAMAQQPYNDIAPLVKSTWDQTSPYNGQTPQSPVTENTFDFTGSAATAMAQIMKYWASGKGSTAIPSYRYYLDEEGTAYSTTHPYDDGYEVIIPSLNATTFDYDWMKDAYQPGETGAAVDAVSKLMRYCGQALETCYTEENTFATMKSTAFSQYFGFNPNSVVVSRNSYSAAEWEALIYSELEAGRPVMYSGTAMAADGSTTHTFIIDGYHDGLFHFNWGWSGYYDGYYKLSEANPGGTGIGGSSGMGGYSMDQKALIWVQPDAMVPVASVLRPDVTGKSQLRVNKVTMDGNMRSGDMVTLTVNVTNIGTLPTSNLYLFIDGVLSLGIGVNIDAGSTDDVQMHFVLEDEGAYQLELFGQIDPARGNANVGEALWTGNVTVGEERQPKLYAVSMRAVNANSEQIIEETVLRGEAAIRNDDTEFFNNKISFFIFQYNTASKRYYSLKRTNSIVRIEAGETKTIPFQFDDLEPDGKYMVIAYISAEEDGLEEIEGSSRSAEYTIQLPSGIRLVKSDCVNRDTRVFDLSGRRIPSASLSKGLYIIQGHKIVAK
jgi:hypothetical protein